MIKQFYLKMPATFIKLDLIMSIYLGYSIYSLDTKSSLISALCLVFFNAWFLLWKVFKPKIIISNDKIVIPTGELLLRQKTLLLTDFQIKVLRAKNSQNDRLILYYSKKKSIFFKRFFKPDDFEELVALLR